MESSEVSSASEQATAPPAFEREILDTVLDSLLGEDPPPRLMAIDERGLCVPLPPEVPVTEGYEIEGASTPLELCVPDDLPKVVKAWEQARATGGGRVAVRFRWEPEKEVILHLVDARHRYGVFLAIAIGVGTPLEQRHVASPLFRARSCTIERDEVSVIRVVGPTTSEVLGWSNEELIGKRTLDFLHPDDRAQAIAHWMEMLRNPGLGQRTVLRYRHRDGHYLWVDSTYRNLLNDPDCGRVITELVDVSDRMETVEALRASEQLLRRLTEALPIGVVQVDLRRRIVYRNDALTEIVGTAAGDTLDEQFVHVAGEARGSLDAALTRVLAGGADAELELTIEGLHEPRRCTVTLRALTGADDVVTGAIGCVTDVTERVRMRDELERRAKFDDLTRCLNRVALLEYLETLCAQPDRVVAGIAVVFVDLDHFKRVNDDLGHAAGDQLLRITGQRLQHCTRGGDVVGRLGGDEFLIVCSDVCTADMANAIGRRVDASLRQPVVLGSTSLIPSSSIGIAWTDCDTDYEQLIAAADAAMYMSKRAANGPVVVRH